MNEKPPRSPLDVKGIKTDLSTEEIVEIVRKMRERRSRMVTRDAFSASAPAGF